MMKRKKRPVAGEVIAIPLRDGSFGFGRILKDGANAFYDCKAPEILPISQIISQPVLFRLWVFDDLIQDGTWPIIGRAPLSEDLSNTLPSFIWAFFHPHPFIVTADSPEMIPATPEECQGLERVAVWTPEEVSARLYDSLTGNGEKWIEKIEPSPDLA